MAELPARPMVARPGLVPVRALERGISLLKCFTAQEPRLTLTQLAQAAELDKATTRRLLHTLELSGVVRYEQQQARYGLTIDVLDIAAAVETGKDLHEIAASYIADIAQALNVTVFVWVYLDGYALCTNRCRAPRPDVDVAWQVVGTKAELNAGAGPRVLLAHLSEEERALALQQSFSHRTPDSQTDPETLKQASDEIRARGWELAANDFVIGLAALGVPIFDGRNRLAGALSMTGTTNQFLPGPKNEHLEALTGAAEEIRNRLILC